jgi:GDP-mannose 4,6 dehydratase
MIRRGGGTQREILSLCCEYSNRSGLIFQIPPKTASAGGEKWMSLGPKAAAHWAVVNYREAYGLFAANGILFNHDSPLRPERFVTKKIVCAACRIRAGRQGALKLVA